ncbi:hypothetical protein MTQ01_03055 [Streptomyces sp. XM4193]|uniref:hypothetical protein n=1 Tax=Streptomyces sp. XM4193 TaxID=2929782 RepID=UPI001FF95486|nr:hypothetical protein [Streptomyces sp. XM4193]MCK1795011.1 hypothetical protein [Streptomyces sp. XM4193]
MLYVCSLISERSQVIPNGGGYHLLRFPYGEYESYDVWNMHPAQQPDGKVSSHPDQRSGLIWPKVGGWATLTANIHWEAGNYSELRDQFVRDPLGINGKSDSTATDHRRPSPGMQCFTKSHQIFVHPHTPLGLRVGHTASSSRRVVHAQFKVAIHDDVAAP